MVGTQLVDVDYAIELKALERSNQDFTYLKGANLLERTKPLSDWLDIRRKSRVWPYGKVMKTTPDDIVTYANEYEEFEHKGYNFATQDYLGLTKHASVHGAAKEIIDKFGPHSAGSPMLVGNTQLSKLVERKLAKTFKNEACVISPSL